MKIAMASLGCAKNLVDAENMLGMLTEQGFELTDDESLADVIIVNTCCFINDAKIESIDTIFDVAQWKTDGNCKRLIVTGCMAQRYKEQILTEIPEVDAVVGIGANNQLYETIEKVHNGEEHFSVYGPKTDLDITQKRIISTPKHYAYLKIAEGCSNGCYYCAIPLIRGPHRSRPMESCVEEAQWLADQGVKEVIVVAQDITRYGEDIYKKNCLLKDYF